MTSFSMTSFHVDLNEAAKWVHIIWVHINGFILTSLAAAAVVGVCVGGWARAACVLSPGAGRRPGPLWGPFLLLSCKIYIYIYIYMYSTFM